MKCPWCNSKMEKGYIQSYEREVFYTNEYRRFGSSDENDLVLSKNVFTMPRVDAYICKQCKKIVIEY